MRKYKYYRNDDQEPKQSKDVKSKKNVNMQKGIARGKFSKSNLQGTWNNISTSPNQKSNIRWVLNSERQNKLNLHSSSLMKKRVDNINDKTKVRPSEAQISKLSSNSMM